jgi:hypothetical protein
MACRRAVERASVPPARRCHRREARTHAIRGLRDADPAVADLPDRRQRLRRVRGDVDRDRAVEVDAAEAPVAREQAAPPLVSALAVEHVLAGEQPAHLVDVLDHGADADGREPHGVARGEAGAECRA